MEIPSAFANETFRSTYNLGFLGVTEHVLELELERKLVEKVKQFLLELGKGFAFIGNQHELEFNGKTSKVDMLFFHRQLRCLVAIDLKIGEFKPEYVGKMNYYLSLLDRLERGDGVNKPIGVADYQLLLPKDQLQKILIDEERAFQGGDKGK
ncbi:PDDEXK nuclease domain-containing protein [Fibrobacter sp.]|uniref:PDDEXK nuclease domain-containing protein n=1 Tax=Fibrobacter sp. TaxID=35828 RepID=UPI00388E0C1D